MHAILIPVLFTLASAPQEAQLVDLARGAAAGLPWCFDVEEARARSAAERKPILVYVRCTDDKEHLSSAERSIAAPEIAFRDDGYLKDLLFRLGPLSDPDVAALIERRFVPLCLTYVLNEHTYGVETPAHWDATGGPATTRFFVSEEEGDAAAGSLAIANEDAEDRDPHNWTQAIDPPAELPCELVLEASIKCEGLERGATVGVMVQCWKGQEMVGTGRVNDVSKDCDWKRLDAKFRVPEGTESVRVRALISGKGTVWFDDLALRPAGKGKERPNLLANGAVDEVSAEGAFGALGLSPRRLTTPALVAIDPADGRPARKLHRMGALSSELVDRWLRGVLAEIGAPSSATEAADLYADGELERALATAEGNLAARTLLRLGRYEQAGAAARGADGALVQGIALMRAGEWKRAAEAFERASKGERADEAAFWRGFCLERMGEHAEARELWSAVVGESAIGRKAAACLLRGGPRPTLAETLRAWPADDALPETTELGRPLPYDRAQTVTALLELQRSDGSFGEHMGVEGHGFVDAAITALVVEALRTVAPALPKELRAPAEEAHERALRFLKAWPDQAPPAGAAMDGFNNPYVLMTLVAEGEKAAAKRVIERIAAAQLDDGNWTVYVPDRPASFNTALCVQALLRAKEAKLDVPKDVLKRGVAALGAMRQEGGLFPYSTKDGHEWMTTEHGSIARDALCELVLLEAGDGSKKALEAALERYNRFAHELRLPTKRLYDYFNPRGHGGYYFFFAHWNACQAAASASSKLRKQTLAVARDEVLAAREGDGTFMDKFLLGRAYGSAMALLVLVD